MTQTLELSTRIRQLENAVASLSSLEDDLVRLTSQIQDAHAAREKLEKVNAALEGITPVLVPEPPVSLPTITQRSISLPIPETQPEPETFVVELIRPLPLPTAPEPEPAPEAAPKMPTPARHSGPLNPEAEILRYFAANRDESLARAVAAALPHLSSTTVNATLKSLAESGQLERSGAGNSTSPYWYSVKSVASAPPKPTPAPRAERVNHQANLPRDLPPLSSKHLVASAEEQARILAALKGAPNGLSSSLLNSKLNKEKPIRFDVLVANLEALRADGKALAQDGKWRLR